MTRTVCQTCRKQLSGNSALVCHLGQKYHCRHEARSAPSHSKLRAARNQARLRQTLPLDNVASVATSTRSSNTSESASQHGTGYVGPLSSHPTEGTPSPPTCASSILQSNQVRTFTLYPHSSTGGQATVYPGMPLYASPTVFEVQKEARDRAGLPPHAPFASLAEWQLTEIVIKSGISQGYRDRLLKSEMVHQIMLLPEKLGHSSKSE